MKKIILIFLILILCLGFLIGQCNSTPDDYAYDKISNENFDFLETTITSELGEDTVRDVIKEKNQEYTLDDSLLWVKLPNSLPNQLLFRSSYLTSYNYKTKCPNWVAWHLTAAHTEGPIGRLSNFHEDEDVPMPRATLADYRKSGWSRGHMCPVGDNKWDEQAMYESFALTNVCPQDASLNSGLWNRIEMDCRRWAKKYGGIYIVCGPVFLNKEHETIGENQVVVPEAFFKVILCLQGKPKAIGYIVRNNAGKKKKDQFVNTVDNVERITGMDFFPALSDDIENEVEAHANLDDWR